MENNKMSAEENVIKFLLGESSLEGVWYGEKHPTEQGRFWWRKHLRTQTTSLQKQIEEKDKESNNRYELIIAYQEKFDQLKSQLSQKDEMMERMVEALIKLNDYFFCEKPLDDGEYYDLIKLTENIILQYQNSKK